MDKLIVERPRRGSRHAPNEPKGYKKRQSKCDIEDLPTKESMSAGRKHGWEAKELNENLNPLRRFLQKQVGRPWDKVFSELSEHIDMNSTVKRHIWQHVFDTIEDKTFIGPDGEVWTRGHYGGHDSPLTYSSYKNLYIHPVDGLLKQVKKPKDYKKNKWKPDNRQDRRVNGPGDTQFHKINGIWYIAQLKPLPSNLTNIVVVESEIFGKPGEKRKWERREPTANGKIRDAMVGHQIYQMYDEKNGRDIQFRHTIKVPNDYEPANHWSPKPWSDNGFRYCSYDETITSLYGRKCVYAVSFKQANGKELKLVDLKNDPLEQEEDKK